MVESAIDAMKRKLAGGGGSGSFTGSDVYLGSYKTTPSTSVSPTGVTYNNKGGISLDKTASITEAKNDFYNWTDKEINSFVSRLGSYGFKNVNRITAQQMWEMAVDGAASWYRNSNGTRKITPEQYIQWQSKGQGGEENLPQKQVYLYDNATIKGLIDDTLTNVLGRKATSDENKQFFTKLKQMMNEGTVTTTEKKVVNGKTMNVSTTKAGFSKESAAAAIEEQIKTGTAGQKEDYLQKKSLDFADFLSQLGG